MLKGQRLRGTAKAASVGDRDIPVKLIGRFKPEPCLRVDPEHAFQRVGRACGHRAFPNEQVLDHGERLTETLCEFIVASGVFVHLLADVVAGWEDFRGNPVS